jgi:hypothetical protein
MTLEEFIALPENVRLSRMRDLYTQFTQALHNAGLGVRGEYFKLKYYDGADGDVKDAEHHYCYELFRHFGNQLDQEDFSPFYLTSQVNKALHPEFHGDPVLHRVIPDFAFHTPGRMEGNFVIFEIKPLANVCSLTDKSHKSSLHEDLKKLTSFCDQKRHYYRAIHLIYGNDNEQSINNYGKLCKELSDEAYEKAAQTGDTLEIDLRQIEVYWHPSPQTPVIYQSWEALLPKNQ